jgi:hypothetical protein
VIFRIVSCATLAMPVVSVLGTGAIAQSLPANSLVQNEALVPRGSEQPSFDCGKGGLKGHTVAGRIGVPCPRGARASQPPLSRREIGQPHCFGHRASSFSSAISVLGKSTILFWPMLLSRVCCSRSQPVVTLRYIAKFFGPVPLLGRPAVSTQVDDNLATLAEVRLSAGEPRLDELERGYGLARGPIP